MKELQMASVEDAWMLINPYRSLAGLHYLCAVCEEKYIPEESCIKKPAIVQQTVIDESDQYEPLHTNSTLPNEHEANENQVEKRGRSESTVSAESSHTMSDRREPTHSDKPDITRPTINICKFYARGKCKHGLAGKGCNKPHPRPCGKLLRHGPKSKQNADGCEGWPKCDKWHPKLCRTSVRKKECT